MKFKHHQENFHAVPTQLLMGELNYFTVQPNKQIENGAGVCAAAHRLPSLSHISFLRLDTAKGLRERASKDLTVTRNPEP